MGEIESDFLELTCCCPAEDCDNKKEVEWYRRKCGHRTHINSEAMMKCKKCDTAARSIIEHSFNCGKHLHAEDFREVDSMGLMHAISIMTAAQNFYKDKAWLKRLATSFMREVEKILEQ